MGIHHSPAIQNYWNPNPMHLMCTKNMALERFCQLRRFLHVSNACSTASDLLEEPTGEEEDGDSMNDE